MEFPELGKNCSVISCNKLDFLPVKCDACSNIFCHKHMSYISHNCPKANARDVQVPVCPLCNSPVPSKRGEMPDIAVGDHIDRECQSDPAVERRKVFSNKCKLKGCKKKELVPMVCKDCNLNFCIAHRHPADHNCTKTSSVNNSVQKKMKGSTTKETYIDSIHGYMTEDEALAHAIALSLEENSNLPPLRNSERPSLRNGNFKNGSRNQSDQPPPSSPSSCNIC